MRGDLPLAICCATFFASLAVFTACKENDWQAAEADAKAFVQDYPNAAKKSPTCAHKDSDDDGYCSCTVFLNKGESLETIPLECGCEVWCVNCTRGCKLRNDLQKFYDKNRSE